VAAGNGIGRINEVAVRRTRLVLGWVTIFGGQTTSVFHQTTQANSASYHQRNGKRVPAKSAMTLCGWGVKATLPRDLYDPFLTRAVPVRFRDESG